MSEEQAVPANWANDISYTPASLLHLFNSALAPSATKKIILVKGIYLAGKGVTYAGYFYDTLKDEATDAVLTLVVPALLRNGLTHNKTISFYGYITKRVVLNGGRIEVHAVMTELLQQTVNTYSDKEIRAIGLLQQKAGLGYRDVDGFVKGRIVNEETVRIRILIGKTAIVDSDISHALGEAVGFYNIGFERINLSSEADILQALRRYNDAEANDLLVLSRGGGENMEVFNSPDVAEYCLELEPLFVTAIGHKEDTPLVQKMADKAFITPTALGQYLNRIYNETVEELQHSKARLIETITLQLGANYDKQVRNLEEKIRGLEELNIQRVGLQQQELQLLQGQLLAAQEQVQTMRVTGTRRQLVFWVILIVVALVCVLIGRGCR
ncbi:exodeoxyribonuclease VII large subunit [Puia dinghuensis]|uniref:Exonuclease VII large subunit C-terminal domain-containing protein n=1 Tax=Puia dinghuensis TaxID=1792502 RepID=A0A8J2UCM4_9BACT|nr:exodeoxyribonuclease VII large subunit [Puia dinghuensis]GGA98551.1 hypothetical protein GCM10011511_22330 [Puia dinghuensis]